ncbi:MAG: hypothetical protein EP343_09910 [Deltaproteobacteria bacterium]|nr:MAG: hypothetical protein EP343_09910 [Deltaproteobacteria bacterium]
MALQEQPNNSTSSSPWSRWLGSEALLVLALAAAALPFFFANGSLDGDGLEYLILYKDWFHHGFPFQNWVQPPGRGFELVVVSDYLLFFLSRENIPLTSFLIAWVNGLFLYASTRYVLRVVLNPQRWIAQAIAMGATVLLCWSYYLLCTTYVIFTNANNLRRFLYLSLANFLIARLFLLVQKHRWYDYLWVVAILCVGLTGTAKFAAFVVAPVLGTWMVLTALSWWFKASHSKRMIAATLAGLGASAFGYLVLYKSTLPQFHLWQAYTPKGVKDLSVTFRNFANLVVTSLGGSFLLVLFLLVQVMLFAYLFVRMVQWLRSLTSDEPKPLVYWSHGYMLGLAVGATLCILAFNLLLSKGNISRYYTYIPFYLCLAFLFDVAYRLETKRALLHPRWVPWAIPVVSGVCIVVFLLALPQLKQAKVSWNEMLAMSPKAGDAQSLADCLMRNKEKYNLAYGLAEYWTARPIQMMTRDALRVYQINPKTLNFYHWNNNVSYYWQGTSKLGTPFFNFIIPGYMEIHDEFRRYLRAQDNPKLVKAIQGQLNHWKQKGLSAAQAIKRVAVNSRNVSAQKVRRFFGPPSATFRCNLTSGDVRTVFVYNRKTHFDARLKVHFYRQYMYWRKRFKYPYNLPLPKLQAPSTRRSPQRR